MIAELSVDVDAGTIADADVHRITEPGGFVLAVGLLPCDRDLLSATFT